MIPEMSKLVARACAKGIGKENVVVGEARHGRGRLFLLSPEGSRGLFQIGESK